MHNEITRYITFHLICVKFRIQNIKLYNLVCIFEDSICIVGKIIYYILL